MRALPSGVKARVDRLIKQVVPSPQDLQSRIRARVRRMGDEELFCHELSMIEADVGRLRDHPTSDGLLAALRASKENWSWQSQNRALAFWKRIHWFDQHASHGTPVLVSLEPESLRDERPIGLGIAFECPCARGGPENRARVVVHTYETLVPPKYRGLIPPARILPKCLARSWPPSI